MAIGQTETYFELLPAAICNPTSMRYIVDGYAETGPAWDVTFASTFRPINTADFDGTCAWSFEIKCQNRSLLYSAFAYVVDESGNVCATIEVPAETTGTHNPVSDGEDLPASYEAKDHFRFTATFIPQAGDHQYGLRTYQEHTGYVQLLSGGEAMFLVTEATIVLRQTDPTKSAVHIPMMVEINGASFGAATIPYDLGPQTSTGKESLSLNVEIYNESYPTCEVQDDSHYGQVRQIWKYDDTELKTVSKFVFDAALGYFTPTTTARTRLFNGTPNYSYNRTTLRYSTYENASPTNFDTGSHVTEEATEGGNTFYLISGSDFEWIESEDGHSYSATVELDVTDINAALGKYLYFCTTDNVLGGSLPGPIYAHWGKLGAAVLSIPVGTTITRAYIEYLVYLDGVTGDDVVRATFKYEISAIYNPGYVILYDKTADANVTGSELAWTEYTAWERKSVELDPALFTTGHEYMARWHMTDLGGRNPYPSDVNLTAFVTAMENFTSWRRVTKQWVANTVYETVYTDWGAAVSLNGYGVVQIFSRVKLFKPDNCEIYYELCAMPYSDNSGPSDVRVSLWDCGTQDNAIGTTTSEEIEESALSWTQLNSGYTERQRTADIAQYLTADNRYVDVQPEGPIDSTYYPLSGFIVVHYSLAPGSPSSSPSSSPSDSASASPSASPSEALQPINPWVILQWSDDGGNTWSNEQWRQVGKVGEFQRRVKWNRLARAKDRVFKIVVSDPCKWCLVGVYIDADQGTRR